MELSKFAFRTPGEAAKLMKENDRFDSNQYRYTVMPTKDGRRRWYRTPIDETNKSKPVSNMAMKVYLRWSNGLFPVPINL